MTPIIDGLRYEWKSVTAVKFRCPVCEKDTVQDISPDDTEGSLIGMLPHGNCKDAEVLIRIR